MASWKLVMDDCKPPLIYGYYKARDAVDTLRMIKAADQDFYVKITTFKELWDNNQVDLLSQKMSQIPEEIELTKKIVKDSFLAWECLLETSQKIKKSQANENNSIQLLEKIREAFAKTMKYYITFDINEALTEHLKKNLKQLSPLEFVLLIQPIETEPAKSFQKIATLLLNNKKDEALSEFGWFPGMEQFISEPKTQILKTVKKIKAAREKNKATQEKVSKNVESKFEAEIELVRKTVHWVNWHSIVEKQALFNLNNLHELLSQQLHLENDALSYNVNKINYLLPEEIKQAIEEINSQKIEKDLTFRINKSYQCVRDEKGFRFLGSDPNEN